MTKEEQEAIEYLKKHIIPCSNKNGNIEFLLNEVILNLIDKLQKENEELKELNRIQDKMYEEDLEINEVCCKAEVDLEWTLKIEKELDKLKDKEQELTDEEGYWGSSDLLEEIAFLEELLERCSNSNSNEIKVLEPIKIIDNSSISTKHRIVPNAMKTYKGTINNMREIDMTFALKINEIIDFLDKKKEGD